MSSGSSRLQVAVVGEVPPEVWDACVQVDDLTPVRAGPQEPLAAEVVWVGACPDRYAVCERAISAGAHLLLDLPLPQRIADLQAACQSGGLHLCPVLSRRFAAGVVAVSGCLESGELGRLGLVRRHALFPDIPRLAASDLLQELDLVLTLGGPAAAAADALGASHDPEAVYAAGDGQDLTVQIGFGAGAMAVLHLAVAPAGAWGYSSLMVIGSEGASYDDLPANTHVLMGAGQPVAIPAQPDHTPTAAYLEAFATALRAGSPPPVRLEHHDRAARALARVQELVAAAAVQ